MRLLLAVGRGIAIWSGSTIWWDKNHYYYRVRYKRLLRTIFSFRRKTPNWKKSYSHFKLNWNSTVSDKSKITWIGHLSSWATWWPHSSRTLDGKATSSPNPNSKITTSSSSRTYHYNKTPLINTNIPSSTPSRSRNPPQKVASLKIGLQTTYSFKLMRSNRRMRWRMCRRLVVDMMRRRRWWRRFIDYFVIIWLIGGYVVILMDFLGEWRKMNHN